MNNSERKNSFNPLERNTLSPIEKYEKYGKAKYFFFLY